MPVKRTRPVTILVEVTNLRPIPDHTMSKKDIKWNYTHIPTTVSLGNLADIHQEDKKSLGLCGISDLDGNFM